MKKALFMVIIACIMVLLHACQTETNTPIETDPTEIKGWDGESITYLPNDIIALDAATPQGYAMLNAADNNQSAIIKSLSPELDNYGGISTGILTLDFNYPVIFQMDIKSVYTQYIVKLFVEGESESFYVLSDESKTGLISINIVDSMLSPKYRERNTQPDPGYATGWKYDNQIKNCYLYIMPKGPDGEIRTAELIVRSIRITNFKTAAIEGVSIESPDMVDGRITRLKLSPQVQLTAKVMPMTVEDQSVTWQSENPEIVSVDQTGKLSFVRVGQTFVTATSTIDMSKIGRIEVRVTSGYENPAMIASYLNGLTFAGSSGILASATLFEDLFNTSWASQENMTQKVQWSPGQPMTQTVQSRFEGSTMLIENYFLASDQAMILEAANQGIKPNHAGFLIELAGNNSTFNTTASATIYRNIDGTLFKESFSNTTQLELFGAYASKIGEQWTKRQTYTEEAIVVWSNGLVTKYRFVIKSVQWIKSYTAADFLNTDLWQDGNSLILAQGSVRDNGNGTITIREENPTKYPYGGLVSELLTIQGNREIEIVIDVTETNPTRVLWDLRMVYFRNGQRFGNPLKIQATNQIGVYTLRFTPVEPTFRIYLIANGSDIGVIAEGAEIKVRSLKIHYLDE